MNHMVRFSYRDFYDVPRMMIFNYKGQKILLDCKFDDSLDEYPSNYKAYVLPQQVNESEEHSWEFMSTKAINYLGEIAINEITFDQSKREAIAAGTIEQLLARLGKLGKLGDRRDVPRQRKR